MTHGPWTTELGNTSAVPLSRFWRRRMKELPGLAQRKPPTGTWRIALAVVCLLGLGMPTLKLATGSANDMVEKLPEVGADSDAAGKPLRVELPGGVPLTASQLVMAMRASRNSISSIRASVSWTVREPKDDTRFPRADFDWGYKDGKQFLRGVDRNIGQDSRLIETSLVAAFDGSKLRTLNTDPTVLIGAVREPRYYFRDYRTPLTFLGHEMIDSPSRDLLDILEESSMKYMGSIAILHSKPFVSSGQSRWAIVSVDVARGFIPIRVEIRGEHELGGLVKIFECRNLREVSPEVWLPLEMSETLFETTFSFPDPKTEERLKRPASMEEYKQLYSTRLVSSTTPFAYSPLILVVDPATIQINEEIADDLFTIDYPPGSRYLDEFTGRRVQVPREQAKGTR